MSINLISIIKKYFLGKGLGAGAKTLKTCNN